MKAHGDGKVAIDQLAEHSTINQLASIDTRPWYKKRKLLGLYLVFVPAILGCNITAGYDSSVMNGMQALRTWNEYYGNPQGSALGTMFAVPVAGSFVSFPLVPWINDAFGRKKSILLGTLIMMVGIIIQSVATNRGMFIAARFIMALGGPISLTAANAMAAELSYPTHRALITGLFNNSWNVGAIIAACVTLGTRNIPSNWSWRIPTVLQISPSLLQLVFIWFVPESPRWLLAKDRLEEARAVLVKYHGEGDPDAALPQAEFLEIQKVMRLDASLPKRNWLDLLRTPANRKRTLIAATVGLFHAWSGNGLVSFYLPKVLLTVGITSVRKQIEINIAINCVMLVSCCTAAVASLRFGRRGIWLTAFGLMAVAYWCLTACAATYSKSHSSAAASATVAFIVIYQMVYSIMQPLQAVYTSEIFPYHLRTKGLVLEAFFNSGGSLFNSFVNPIALLALGWKYYLVYCVWIPVEWIVMYFLYPETKGPTLEELAAVFDGPSALGSKDAALDDVEHADHVQRTSTHDKHAA